ncbi:portal protein [Bosea sp. BK604]|uniref:portal protein n=1 Tax=Bosea sp. BK604 TaxID=2512180 RepID=UPI001046A54F|nr:portal protein [Bosea sp. BK604]TCR64687.1 head-to-tail connecting protein [Bosea sp. BK604]
MAGEKTKLEKEAAQRLADCRRQKSLVDTDLREGYFFTAPQRCRDVTSTTSPTDRGRETDMSELQISLGMQLAQDFATEMLNTFTPEVIEWAQQKAGIDIEDEEQRGALETQIAEQTTVIMEAMKASNLYAALSLAYMPDLALGTVGLWIDDLRPSEPIVNQAVPLREIEVNIGPYGEIDDRFIVRHTRYRHLPALLRGVDLPADIEKKIKDKPGERCILSWGWWRLWDKDSDVYWQAVIRVGEKVVADAELRGEGSCPLIVGRFNPDTIFSFGQGPALQALPDLRRLDETEALKIENADFQIHPPFIYADDGVMNFETGIEPGMGYKARPWQHVPVEKLSFEGNVSFAEFETQRIEQGIRKLFFADYPEQIGKTPPTAEQWLDEMQRAKRRIGTPGKIFFKEVPAEIFKRFKFLLAARGVIEDIKVDGKTVALTPYDPTEQAQEFQEVQIALRVLEAARNYFPETMQVEIDGSATVGNIKKKLRDKIVVQRDPEQLKQAIQQFGPLLAGGGGDAGGGPAGPAPGVPTA